MCVCVCTSIFRTLVEQFCNIQFACKVWNEKTRYANWLESLWGLHAHRCICSSCHCLQSPSRLSHYTEGMSSHLDQWCNFSPDSSTCKHRTCSSVPRITLQIIPTSSKGPQWEKGKLKYSDSLHLIYEPIIPSINRSLPVCPRFIKSSPGNQRPLAMLKKVREHSWIPNKVFWGSPLTRTTSFCQVLWKSAL